MQVDLTLHGHHHSYQRTCPTIAGRCKGPRARGERLSSVLANSNNGGEVGGRHATIVDAAAPVHLLIGNSGYVLDANLDAGRSKRIFQVWLNTACQRLQLAQCV